MDKSILSIIGKAIREGKYLSITYKNIDGNITPFWISILDINANGELFGHLFNITKDEPIFNAKIFISKIQTAEILRFSHYETPENLVNKIVEDDSLKKYGLDNYNNNILSYYLECYKSNKDPFLYKQHLIPGLELNKLLKQSPYLLTNNQQKKIIQEIYHNDYNKFYEYELALSEFSIDLEAKGKYVIAYRKLTFDPIAKTIEISDKVHFNSNFYIKGNKFSLSYYSDMSPIDFEEAYNNDKMNTIGELTNAFKSGEIPNTRPEIIVLGYEQIDISPIYERIDQEHKKGALEIPLKSFFQNMSSLDRKNRTKPNIVLYDNKVNIDQLRSIYNALKYPVTYVQGPPGTGKT